MNERVEFSGQELSLDDIAVFYENVRAALLNFLPSDNFCRDVDDEIEADGDDGDFEDEGEGEGERKGNRKRKHNRVRNLRDECLIELDMTSSMSVMASLEAAIRIDYLNRAQRCRNDALSKSMRLLHDSKRNRARLEREILPVWADHAMVSKLLLDRVNGAFKFRHWLAHGRYWRAYFRERYDYHAVFEIASELISAMRACSDSVRTTPASSRSRRANKTWCS